MYHITHLIMQWNLSITDMIQVPLIGVWNREVPEMSSLQGVGIEEFHYIQRCPHFRELE